MINDPQLIFYIKTVSACPSKLSTNQSAPSAAAPRPPMTNGKRRGGKSLDGSAVPPPARRGGASCRPLPSSSAELCPSPGVRGPRGPEARWALKPGDPAETGGAGLTAAPLCRGKEKKKQKRINQHDRLNANTSPSLPPSLTSPLPLHAPHFGSRRRHASRDGTAQVVARVTMCCNPKLSCAWSPESIFTPDLSLLVREPSDSHSPDHSRLIQMVFSFCGGRGGPWEICLDLQLGF